MRHATISAIIITLRFTGLTIARSRRRERDLRRAVNTAASWNNRTPDLLRVIHERSGHGAALRYGHTGTGTHSICIYYDNESARATAHRWTEL